MKSKINEAGLVDLQVSQETYDAIAAYQSANPDWSGDRILSAAMGLFLMQDCNGKVASYRQSARMYLNALFQMAKENNNA